MAGILPNRHKTLAISEILEKVLLKYVMNMNWEIFNDISRSLLVFENIKLFKNMLKPDDKDDIILYITVIGVPVDNSKRLHISIVDCVDLFCIRFSYVSCLFTLSSFFF